jgi:hypothetical protein
VMGYRGMGMGPPVQVGRSPTVLGAENTNGLLLAQMGRSSTGMGGVPLDVA